MAIVLAQQSVPESFSICDDQLAICQMCRLLTDSSEVLSAQLNAAECRDHGALPVYGQWLSCSMFELPLQIRIDDAALMRQLVSTASSSESTSGLQLLLTLASASLSHNMAAAVSAWFDAGLFNSITRALAADQSTATRKLAFDLAYVAVHSRLRIAPASTAAVSHDILDFGFEDLLRDAGGPGCAAAAREYQIVSLFAILLSSVTAQITPHYPFMPLKFFENVHWPLSDPAPCHARLRSIVSLYRGPPSRLPADVRSVGRKQLWFNSISAAALLRLEAAMRAPSATACHAAVAAAAAQAHALLSQFILRAFAIDNSIFVTSSSCAKRERDAALREVLSESKTLPCPCCNASAPKPSGMLSLFSQTSFKACSVCLLPVCPPCASNAGWCGTRACARCFDSITALGLVPSGKKKPRKPSLLSSLRDLVIPGKAEPKDKDWPRDYKFSDSSSAHLKPDCASGCADADTDHRSELQEWRDGDVSAGEEDDCDGFADDRLCCSIMLQDDLREWRDADNEI